MNVQKQKLCSKSDSKLSSYQELVDYLYEHGTKKLLECVSHNIHKLNVDEKTFCFIFRQVKPYLKAFFDFSSNFNTNCNISTEGLNLDSIKVFSRVVMSIDFDFCIFLNYFSETEISKTFENLHSPDESIRSVSKLLIEAIYKRFHLSYKIFQEIFANELLEFIDNPRQLKETEFIYKMLRNMIINNDIQDDIEEYYKQFVLPSLILMPFSSSENVNLLIETFCTHIPKFQKITLRYISKVFSRVDSNDQVKIMEFTTTIIHSYFINDPLVSLDFDFSEILNLGFTSENYLVIDASINMINDSAVKRFIEIHIRAVLPLIFVNLYRLSKKFWRLEQRCKAIQAIGNILNTDINTFESCVVDYNKKKYHSRYSDPILDDEKYFNDKLKEINSNFKK